MASTFFAILTICELCLVAALLNQNVSMYELVLQDYLPSQRILEEVGVGSKTQCASKCMTKKGCNGFGFDSPTRCFLLKLDEEVCEAEICSSIPGVKVFEEVPSRQKRSYTITNANIQTLKRSLEKSDPEENSIDSTEISILKVYCGHRLLKGLLSPTFFLDGTPLTAVVCKNTQAVLGKNKTPQEHSFDAGENVSCSTNRQAISGFEFHMMDGIVQSIVVSCIDLADDFRMEQSRFWNRKSRQWVYCEGNSFLSGLSVKKTDYYYNLVVTCQSIIL